MPSQCRSHRTASVRYVSSATAASLYGMCATPPRSAAAARSTRTAPASGTSSSRQTRRVPTRGPRRGASSRAPVTARSACGPSRLCRRRWTFLPLGRRLLSSQRSCARCCAWGRLREAPSRTPQVGGCGASGCRRTTARSRAGTGRGTCGCMGSRAHGWSCRSCLRRMTLRSCASSSADSGWRRAAATGLCTCSTRRSSATSCAPSTSTRRPSRRSSSRARAAGSSAVELTRRASSVVWSRGRMGRG
mmetsp:Transcript_38590/g.94946  ORF Transcript_38590/g.94946 Transcript_38590/m.94946 type:complete len:247 (+) Transcript_38590:387-1127(+)